MARLILIKHSLPEIEQNVPSADWLLSDTGRARCDWLAEQMRLLGVRRMFTSDEPKAAETGQLTARMLGLEAPPRVDLHENDRTNLGFLPSNELRARLHEFFDFPNRLVMGRETAEVAVKRFSKAVDNALKETRGATTAIVTHGTVLTLFVSQHNPKIPRFQMWDVLGLPSFVVLEGNKFEWDGKVHNHPG